MQGSKTGRDGLLFADEVRGGVGGKGAGRSAAQADRMAQTGTRDVSEPAWCGLLAASDAAIQASEDRTRIEATEDARQPAGQQDQPNAVVEHPKLAVVRTQGPRSGDPGGGLGGLAGGQEGERRVAQGEVIAVGSRALERRTAQRRRTGSCWRP